MKLAPSFVAYTGSSCPWIERTISYSAPASPVEISSAFAPCPFAKDSTFSPASSELIVGLPLVDRVIINRIARMIVESAQ